MSTYPDWFIHNGQPPEIAEGDDLAEKIFAQVGEICTAWTMVDDALLDIFTQSLSISFAGTVNLASAMAILDSHSVIKGRITLIKAQISMHGMKNDSTSNALGILKKTEKVARLRNNVVHGVVRKNQNFPTGKQFALQPPTSRAMLGFITSSKSDQPVSKLEYQYNSETLRQIAACLWTLCNGLKSIHLQP